MVTCEDEQCDADEGSILRRMEPGGAVDVFRTARWFTIRRKARDVVDFAGCSPGAMATCRCSVGDEATQPMGVDYRATGRRVMLRVMRCSTERDTGARRKARTYEQDGQDEQGEQNEQNEREREDESCKCRTTV